MLWTCACILAVDFTYFPRRFAKATTFGSGMLPCFSVFTIQPREV